MSGSAVATLAAASLPTLDAWGDLAPARAALSGASGRVRLEGLWGSAASLALAALLPPGRPAIVAVADEPTLKAIAIRTGGTYHAAKDAGQLQKVFSDLPSEVATQRERTEVTWLVAALGALLATAAVAASLRWSPYP